MFKHRLAVIVGRVTYAEDHVWAWRPRPCWQCGRPTHWVELHFEAPTHRGRCTRNATQGWIAANNAVQHRDDTELDRLRDVLQRIADDTCRCEFEEFQFLTYCSPCSVCVAREALLGDPPASSADTTVDYPQIGPPRTTSSERGES